MFENHKTLREFEPPLAVEQLIYEVDEAAFETWKSAEFDIWTKGEADRFAFYRGKETWLERRGGSYLVTIIIYWDSVEQWHSIDPEWLEATERHFEEVVGAGNHRLVSGPHLADRRVFKISEYR